jgi:hypothetical protein
MVILIIMQNESENKMKFRNSVNVEFEMLRHTGKQWGN